MFEDDDYALRVRGRRAAGGLRDDVFVHHFGEASLGALAADGRYGELFDANRAAVRGEVGPAVGAARPPARPRVRRARRGRRRATRRVAPPGARLVS